MDVDGEVDVEVEVRVLFLFQQSGNIFFCSSAITLARWEYCSLSSNDKLFQASPSSTLIALKKYENSIIHCELKLEIYLMLGLIVFQNTTYLLSFPGCCWISSSRYFLANSIKPFIGRFGFSLAASFSFFRAGDIGGDIAWLLLFPPTTIILLPTASAELLLEDIPGWCKATGLGMMGATLERGELGSVNPVVNSNLRNLSHRSGVLTASWWSGGRHTSPIDSSLQGIPNFSNVNRDCAELQPKLNVKYKYNTLTTKNNS